ncbi:MAG TPA: lipoyl(octanoyl) transferase LipB [Tepidisphaeraceae bacterium]|jgi:lipoyl(octanoyl) transferase|nr:lipoyl(octanoyl) transferase LipB [Tepidisphaeraceae bacterium]
MTIHDLGQLPYRDAWAIQERAHEEVLAGGEERIYFVEHPPVITYGRRPGVDQHLVATPAQLAERSVEIVQSDRGGDITFHGPGQLVAYPIIRLADHGLSVGGYVHTLEAAIVALLADLGIAAHADPAAIGVWTLDQGAPAKICAFGVRIRRGVSLHGLALNVTTDLDYFNLIIPCGLAGRPVTSLLRLMGRDLPDFSEIRASLATHLRRLLG